MAKQSTSAAIQKGDKVVRNELGKFLVEGKVYEVSGLDATHCVLAKPEGGVIHNVPLATIQKA